MSSAVDVAGDPIPTSAVVAKHIQFRCQEENVTRIRTSVSTKSSGHSLRPQLAERMSVGLAFSIFFSDSKHYSTDLETQIYEKSLDSAQPISVADDEDQDEFPLPKKSVIPEPPLSSAEDEDRNQPPNKDVAEPINKEETAKDNFRSSDDNEAAVPVENHDDGAERECLDSFGVSLTENQQGLKFGLIVEKKISGVALFV